MKTVFNVLEYGASGDGCTMNTAAIAKAVAAVKAAGGGELYFPAGTYLSGTISAVDNLTIHLAPGATLLASGDFSDYVIARPGQYQSCEFISACDVENFTIYGADSVCCVPEMSEWIMSGYFQTVPSLRFLLDDAENTESFNCKFN